MNKVISKDGTSIVFDQLGAGPAVIFIAGALCDRTYTPLSALSKLFTIVNYDRRGRGDSGNTLPYDVAREIEDIDALIDEMGGSVYLYGHSSGAALALEATLKLDKKIKKLAIYEPPYNTDEKAQKESEIFEKQLQKLLDSNLRGEAIEFFLKSAGMPDEAVKGMQQSQSWSNYEALAPTIAYDNAVVGGMVPIKRASTISVPTLIMHGSESYSFMSDAALALHKAIPNSQYKVLKDQTHEVKPEVLVPFLIDFFKSNK